MPPAETISGEKKQKFSWQKLQNLRHSFSKRKLAISLAIVASLSLSWAGGYSLAKVEQTKDKAVETIEKTGNSAIDISEQKL